jgi:hypothetical protein
MIRRLIQHHTDAEVFQKENWKLKLLTFGSLKYENIKKEKLFSKCPDFQSSATFLFSPLQQHFKCSTIPQTHCGPVQTVE